MEKKARSGTQDHRLPDCLGLTTQSHSDAIQSIGYEILDQVSPSPQLSSTPLPLQDRCNGLI